ncbi:MAG TPA: hypothetical protein VEU55_08410 [Gemmatimonadales bacterium]|nr:hypothetical protein [Gemmatimonadales bacterium]
MTFVPSQPRLPAHLTFLRWYYLATPLFWIAGAVWGVNVRVAFLDDFPTGRNIYYVLCCLIGVAAVRAPQYASRLALAESATNLGLLVGSLALWYLRMLEWAASPAVAVRVVKPAELVGFVLAVGVAAVSYRLRAVEVAAASPEP